jgi:transcriptional regulator with PAS, ATPase and Fis domain
MKYLKEMFSRKKPLINFANALEKAERDIYIKAYLYYNKNQSATAKALGIARGTFLTKMKRWELL